METHNVPVQRQLAISNIRRSLLSYLEQKLLKRGFTIVGLTVGPSQNYECISVDIELKNRETRTPDEWNTLIIQINHELTDLTDEWAIKQNVVVENLVVKPNNNFYIRIYMRFSGT